MSIRLKVLRLQARLTLEELAQRAQLTRSYVSKLERGLSSPSIGAALKLAHALDISVEALFGDASSTDPVTIIRKETKSAAFGGSSTVRLVTGAGAGQRLLGFLLRPSDASPAVRSMSHHLGEEMLYVVSGSISLHLARRQEVLGAGDSAHFNAAVPHKITNLGGVDTEVLIVILPDSKSSN